MVELATDVNRPCVPGDGTTLSASVDVEPDDYVGIVAFDSSASVVMSPTRWGDTSREEAMAHVDDLGAGGGTDMYDGLSTARDALGSLEHRPATDDAVREAERQTRLVKEGGRAERDRATRIVEDPRVE